MSKRTVTVNVVDVRRVGTSKNGNPTYDVITDTGNAYRTAVDAQVGYAADNYRPRTAREAQVETVLHLESDRVVRMTLPDGTDR